VCGVEQVKRVLMARGERDERSSDAGAGRTRRSGGELLQGGPAWGVRWRRCKRGQVRAGWPDVGLAELVQWRTRCTEQEQGSGVDGRRAMRPGKGRRGLCGLGKVRRGGWSGVTRSWAGGARSCGRRLAGGRHGAGCGTRGVGPGGGGGWRGPAGEVVAWRPVAARVKASWG
jgi:hypothetical protein